MQVKELGVWISTENPLRSHGKGTLTRIPIAYSLKWRSLSETKEKHYERHCVFYQLILTS